MAKSKNDIDNDPMFDVSDKARSNARDSILLQGIERIERLEEEKKGMADDIRDVYAEYKSQGYDAKIMRMIVKLRKMSNDDRLEMEAILETYKAEVGLA